MITSLPLIFGRTFAEKEVEHPSDLFIGKLCNNAPTTTAGFI